MSSHQMGVQKFSVENVYEKRYFVQILAITFADCCCEG